MEKCDCKYKPLVWVRGNTQPLIIPLESQVATQEGVKQEPYYPDEDSTVVVILKNGYGKTWQYEPVVDGNLLRITEDGTLPTDIYDVEIDVMEPDGTHRRSLWERQVVVTNDNKSVLEEWNEFADGNLEACAAIFFFAKGDKGEKGDAFTYEDFTPEQLEGLRGPAGQDGRDGADGISGGLLFPSMNFGSNTGVLTITGLEQEVNRIGYDEKTAELIIRLWN